MQFNLMFAKMCYSMLSIHISSHSVANHDDQWITAFNGKFDMEISNILDHMVHIE